MQGSENASQTTLVITLWNTEKTMKTSVQRAPALVELENLSKTYGTGNALKHALRNVHLRIHPGEFVAITGPEQSGLSTCMHILACEDLPTSGSYRLQGLHTEILPKKQRDFLRRNYVGCVFPKNHVFYPVSILENIAFPMLYCGVPAAKQRVRALNALKEVDLKKWHASMPGELSLEQQHRVAIARAIVTNPKILLIDEPAEPRDMSFSNEIMELLSRIHEERKVTVILATHDENKARYAHRRVYCREGHVHIEK